MSMCQICGSVRLTRHYVVLGSCAKCTKKIARCKGQCAGCLEVGMTLGSDEMCGSCRDRITSMSEARAELIVKDFLRRATDLPPAIHNKCDTYTRTACTRSRVDFRLDFEYFQIIIEVDEHQHRAYSSSCELARLLEVVNGSGGIPIMVFRINPDKYTKRAKTYQSPELQDRLIFMKERILKRCQNVTRRIEHTTRGARNIILPILYVEYLFFNSDNDSDIQIRSYLHDTDILKSVAKCR